MESPLEQTLNRFAKECSEAESMSVPRRFNEVMPILIEEILEMRERIRYLENKDFGT